MPRSPENAERRRGALAALRELLRQGLDVETPCKVQDWACFLDEALSRLMATEIIDLLPWDDLAMTRKNKKSLKSQNQRVIVDFDCFYTVLIAHIALRFSAKQMELVRTANILHHSSLSSTWPFSKVLPFFFFWLDSMFTFFCAHVKMCY